MSNGFSRKQTPTAIHDAIIAYSLTNTSSEFSDAWNKCTNLRNFEENLTN